MTSKSWVDLHPSFLLFQNLTFDWQTFIYGTWRAGSPAPSYPGDTQNSKKPCNGEVPGLDADKNAERLAIFAPVWPTIFNIGRKRPTGLMGSRT
jgi:hypothetical protein